jgi:hypothetical protein
MYLSDFWLLKKNYLPLNDTLNDQNLNLTLNFKNYQAYWYNFQQNFVQQQKRQQEEWGLESIDLDEIKRMIIETDKVLLGVTLFVSCLHTIFEVLAFKSDISFWRNMDSTEGISVKTLWF